VFSEDLAIRTIAADGFGDKLGRQVGHLDNIRGREESFDII